MPAGRCRGFTPPFGQETEKRARSLRPAGLQGKRQAGTDPATRCRRGRPCTPFWPAPAVRATALGGRGAACRAAPTPCTSMWYLGWRVRLVGTLCGWARQAVRPKGAALPRGRRSSVCRRSCAAGPSGHPGWAAPPAQSQTASPCHLGAGGTGRQGSVGCNLRIWQRAGGALCSWLLVTCLQHNACRRAACCPAHLSSAARFRASSPCSSKGRGRLVSGDPPSSKATQACGSGIQGATAGSCDPTGMTALIQASCWPRQADEALYP